MDEFDKRAISIEFASESGGMEWILYEVLKESLIHNPRRRQHIDIVGVPSTGVGAGEGNAVVVALELVS
jgi:hypothetical protein